MRRRHWLAAVALLVAGCSSSEGPQSSSSAKTKTKKKGTRKPPKVSAGRKQMNSGPQGFGNVLVPSYIEDLKSGSPGKQIAAAAELANMGSNAKEALPVLEELASDSNARVSAAAKAAAAAIKQR
jgi:hypothetical protein